jgi:putative endonuclease
VSSNSRVAGLGWESKAAAYLTERGLKILERGYRCRLGELDIVGSDDGTLVIVEVKARRRTSKGTALETVGSAKQQKIVCATRHFLMRNPHWFSRPIRFDVVAIDEIDTDEPKLNWVKNAFSSA